MLQNVDKYIVKVIPIFSLCVGTIGSQMHMRKCKEQTLKTMSLKDNSAELNI